MNIKGTLFAEWRYVSRHLQEQMFGDPLVGLRPRINHRYFLRHIAFISTIKLSNLEEVIKYEFWIKSMQDELN